MAELTKQTAEEAAVQIFSVERTIRPEASRNISFGRRFSHPERNPHLGWNPDPRTIRSFQFVNVVLDAEFRGLYNSDGFIHGIGYLISDEVMAGVGMQASRLVPAPSDATVIVGCNVAHANYFQWVTQALPAIDHAVNRIGQARNIATALASIRSVTIDDPAKQYALARPEYSELLNGGAAFSNSATTVATYRLLREAVDAPWPGAWPLNSATMSSGCNCIGSCSSSTATSLFYRAMGNVFRREGNECSLCLAELSYHRWRGPTAAAASPATERARGVAKRC